LASAAWLAPLILEPRLDHDTNDFPGLGQRHLLLMRRVATAPVPSGRAEWAEADSGLLEELDALVPVLVNQSGFAADVLLYDFQDRVQA
jgi:hypothetical protein